MTKLKLKSHILDLPINPFWKKKSYFFRIIFIYINLSAKYYQENKERLQNKACERYQNFSKKEKEKKQQYGLNVKIMSQKMKNESLLSTEKNIIE